jgi:hypothetical protein
VIKARFEGTRADFGAFLESFSLDGWTLIDTSRPYENRGTNMFRWYLTFKKDH